MSKASDRNVCIHGHFYQPPRENPWLDRIEHQESAHPWHDWNLRIHAECYGPNAHARILDEHNRLVNIINNYEHISFNFGPTLLSWMAENEPETHEAIVAADANSVKARSGHGNALAQAHSHLIMPLASERDKITQVIWGIEDFKARFNRDPEGMWLPETAVDTATLRVLAEHGITFTILAPGQAARVREPDSDHWHELNPAAIDPSRPYYCDLGDGRSITLFFYDGPVSHDIAFRQLLNNGEDFRRRLMDGFSDARPWPQIMNIATDGESYGHHHRYGEMALAYVIQKLLDDESVQLTNYGEFLEKHPPAAEVEIAEPSSWSCAHGVGRWKEDCGCSLSQKPGWNQKWRAPLRASLDIIRDRADDLFETNTGKFFNDPWAVRNDYIRVLVDPDTTPEKFLGRHVKGSYSTEERVMMLTLLEMQRNRILMYTSCGWFFDDISGIESLQILRYAGRALQLAESYDESLKEDFLAELDKARSNTRGRPTGADLFRSIIEPQVTSLDRVAAHFVISMAFKKIDALAAPPCYTINAGETGSRHEDGDRVLVIQHVTVRDRHTSEERDLIAVVTYLGDVDFRCSVKMFESDQATQQMIEDIEPSFTSMSATELVRKLDEHFPGEYYSLKDLFLEQRSAIVELATRRVNEEMAGVLELFHTRNRQVAVLLQESDARPPDIVLAAARFVINQRFATELNRINEGEFPEELDSIMSEAQFWGVQPDIQKAEKIIRKKIEALARQLDGKEQRANLVEHILSYLDLCAGLDISPDLGEAQIYFFITATSIKSQEGGRLPKELADLAERLYVKV